MNFAEANRQYIELKQQFDAGTLSAEAFDQALKGLMVQDAQDVWWSKSRSTGEWNYYDAATSTWIAGQPPGSQPPSTGPQRTTVPTNDSKSKVTAGLLGILLGTFGIHKFYLGYTTEGAIMLIVSLVGIVVTLGVASGIVGIIGFIEGIIYLTKSDEEFSRQYVQARKGWF